MVRIWMHLIIFIQQMNKGERAITIDEVPLEWCFQNAVKLDYRHFEDGYVVTEKRCKRRVASN